MINRGYENTELMPAYVEGMTFYVTVPMNSMAEIPMAYQNALETVERLARIVESQNKKRPGYDNKMVELRYVTSEGGRLKAHFKGGETY